MNLMMWFFLMHILLHMQIANRSLNSVVCDMDCGSLLLAGFSDELLELLLFALEDLRKLLKEKGSNLMIRFGTAEDVIQNLVKEVVKYIWLVCF